MKKLIIALFVATSLAGALVPALFTIQRAGGWAHWQGVLPKGTTDSLYYDARIRQVLDGHPLVGNPYAYEHRTAISPASFIPDDIAALPMFLGAPFDVGVLLNIFIWGLVLLVLAYGLLRLLWVEQWWAALWALLAYAASYSFMLRPTVMQIVYPVFLLFLIAFLRFLYEPSRRRALWLAGAAALTFYIYTFVAYVVLLTLGLTFLWYLATRRFAQVRALLEVALASTVLLIPFGIYTLRQMHDPNYLATFVRIGLVHTHIPSAEAFYYGRWIGLAGAAFVLLWVLARQKGGEVAAQSVFWVTTSAALIVALFLNVFTGVELTLGVHIGRIAIPWVPLALGAALYAWWEVREVEVRRALYVFTALVLLALAAGTAASVRRGFDFFGYDARGETVASVQAYAAPLAWLEANVPQPSVIWSDDAIAQYVPIMTRHYPLFFEGVGLHFVSNQEMQERYLLSRSLGTLSVDQLKADFGLYAGAGAQKLEPLAANQRAWLCGEESRFFGARTCPPPTDAIALAGEPYFTTLLQQFAVVKKNQAALLARYHVSYLIVDRAHDTWKDLPLQKAVYDDGRFAILRVPF